MPNQCSFTAPCHKSQQGGVRVAKRTNHVPICGRREKEKVQHITVEVIFPTPAERIHYNERRLFTAEQQFFSLEGKN